MPEFYGPILTRRGQKLTTRWKFGLPDGWVVTNWKFELAKRKNSCVYALDR